MNIQCIYGRNRMTDFLKNVIKDVGNEYASLVIDGVETYC